MSQPHGHASPSPSTERTPLIPPGPSTADAAPEAELERQPNGESSGLINGHANGTGSKYDSSTSEPQSLSLTRTTLTALALGGLILLQATNISILTTTQSAIASDLDAFERTSWFTSAYLIAMSALGPLNGKFAAVFTPRICIAASAVVLACGVVASGLASGFGTFVAGRVLTGAGAAGIFTVSIIVVLELTGPARRGLAIGLLNTGFTIGVAVGATAAGALLPHTGWRWLFLAQAPIALFGAVVLLFSVPSTYSTGAKNADNDLPTLTRLAKLDYAGAVTLTATITLTLYSLGSPKHIPLLPLLLAPLVLAIFLYNEIYVARDPIIPIPLLKSRGLLLTCLATVGFMMARWTVLFYTPVYALAVRGWSPATSGSILVPTNFGFALGGLAAGGLHIRRAGSFYTPTLVVYAIFPLTLALLAALSTRESPAWLLFADVILCGAATGAALNYNLAHLLHLTPSSTHYVATSLLATFRGFSGSFGSAIGGGLFSRNLYSSLTSKFAERGIANEDLVRRLLGSPALVSNLEGVEKQVAVEGYEAALKSLFLAGTGLAAVMVFVQAGTGWKGVGEEESVLEAEREGLVRRQEEGEDEVGG